MDKRYLRWLLLVALLSILAAQFDARPELRAFLSRDYWQSLMRYGKVLRIVESEYVHADDVNFHDLTDIALREAVRSLDAYSDYMKAAEYEEFNMAANQEYVGVGIEISEFSGRVIISQVFEQGSAENAGVLSGDLIVGIDGSDMRGESLTEVVERIRGEPGTIVVLDIERPITGELISFDLERVAIALDSVVDVEMKTGNVGYLKVRQFIDATDEEMLAAIETLNEQGMKGLILDLRSNPGGRLDTAARMAEIFLEEGQTILTVQSRRGVDDVFHARETEHTYTGPIIVLIDGGSASASEILAGALRDNKRALLVGEKSFGKGSVQSVIGFHGGDGLKLTSARYLLPSGEAINGTGVSPDITAEMAADDSILLILQKHHLRQMSEDVFARTFGFAPVEDSQLKVATEILEAKLLADTDTL
jgi:carboxyl-terminal processing protease